MCELELQGQRPTSVSLVSNPCENAENDLQIIDNQPPDGVQKMFGVCTKQMQFESQTFVARFVEWVHILRILGVEKIHGYNRYVHKDLFKVMNYFEDKNFLEMKPFLEPAGSFYILRSWATRALERNLLNDCFYRNKNLYKYIVVLDPDEIIMPVKKTDHNLTALMKNFKDAEIWDYFYFQYFFFKNNDSLLNNDVPKQFYMLRHIKVS